MAPVVLCARQASTHDSIEDARTALRLYEVYKKVGGGGLVCVPAYMCVLARVFYPLTPARARPPLPRVNPKPCTLCPRISCPIKAVAIYLSATLKTLSPIPMPDPSLLTCSPCSSPPPPAPSSPPRSVHLNRPAHVRPCPPPPPPPQLTSTSLLTDKLAELYRLGKQQGWDPLRV